jgi:hypothetical protein
VHCRLDARYTSTFYTSTFYTRSHSTTTRPRPSAASGRRGCRPAGGAEAGAEAERAASRAATVGMRWCAPVLLRNPPACCARARATPLAPAARSLLGAASTRRGLLGCCASRSAWPDESNPSESVAKGAQRQQAAAAGKRSAEGEEPSSKQAAAEELSSGSSPDGDPRDLAPPGPRAPGRGLAGDAGLAADPQMSSCEETGAGRVSAMGEEQMAAKLRVDFRDLTFHR